MSDEITMEDKKKAINVEDLVFVREYIDKKLENDVPSIADNAVQAELGEYYKKTDADDIFYAKTEANETFYKKTDTVANAESASDAQHANQADEATHATTADTATNADKANHANTATSATTAGKADNATYADSAATAGSAGTATYAETAGEATNAGHADTSGHANTAGSAGTAEIADYASSDKTKGTIEERLTRLGFREGAVENLVATASTNFVKRQGNYVIGKLDFGDNSFKHTTGCVIGVVPTEFRPKQDEYTFASFKEAVYDPGAYFIYYIYGALQVKINTNGEISIVDIAGETYSWSSNTYSKMSTDTTLLNINESSMYGLKIQFGYEAAEIN